MKIEFLNDDLTEAKLTKGRLWWKKTARVVYIRSAGFYLSQWHFTPSMEEVDIHTKLAILTAKAGVERSRTHARRETNWSKP